MKVSIYTLKNSMTGEIKYVGQTISPLQVRLSQHISTPVSEGMAKWIDEIGKCNVGIEIVDIVAPSNADVAEAQWISNLSNRGCELLNVKHNVIHGTNRKAHTHNGKLISFRLDSAHAEMVEKLCKLTGMNTSQIVRKLIREA